MIRNDKKIIAPRTKEQIQGGDVLLVEGTAEEIVKIKDVAGLEIKADFKLTADTFSTDELTLVEAMVMPGSRLRDQR